MIARLQIASVLLTTALPAGAASGQAAADVSPVVRDAWVRESTATRTSSSAYFTIDNLTAKPVALVRVAVDGAGDVQMHAILEQHGQTAMKPLTAVPIPAHGSVALSPGGTHVMLMDLARPLKAGTTVEMALTFDNQQTRRVRAVVRPLTAMSAR